MLRQTLQQCPQYLKKSHLNPLLYTQKRYNEMNQQKPKIPYDAPQGSVLTGTAHSTTAPAHNPNIQSQLSIQSPSDILDHNGNPQRPSPMEYISKVPVIFIDNTVAVCDGGPGGHPREFIQLNTVKDQPSTCKYCGLRYQMKHQSHDNVHHKEPDATGY